MYTPGIGLQQFGNYPKIPLAIMDLAILLTTAVLLLVLPTMLTVRFVRKHLSERYPECSLPEERN